MDPNENSKSNYLDESMDTRDGSLTSHLRSVILAREEETEYVQNQFDLYISVEENARSFTDMMDDNKCSVEIDYMELKRFDDKFADILACEPEFVLYLMEFVATEAVNQTAPEYIERHPHIYVRITNFPYCFFISELRADHIKLLIKVGGVVTGISHKLRNERPLQVLTIQEHPSYVYPGRHPREVDVILLNDLIRCYQPGDFIVVTGIYGSYSDFIVNEKKRFLSTFIEANYLTKEVSNIARFDNSVRLSRDPNIGRRIIQSIAPFIHGSEDVKTALALAIFGGHGNNKIRGDIHVLIVGDPATGKSKFLEYVQGTGRMAAAFGKGVDGAFPGGAFLMTDGGICLIDDFDRMMDEDREIILETMEKQTINIFTDGFVQEFNARCSVIATASPEGGRYKSGTSFFDQVNLTSPVVSSFDIICVMQDEVNEQNDRKLADIVLQCRKDAVDRDNRSDDGLEIMPPEILREYISHARMKVFPRILHFNYEDIPDYEELVQVYPCMHGHRELMTERNFKVVLRMSEAHARMHLRSDITSEDVQMALNLLLKSQGYLARTGNERETISKKTNKGTKVINN